MKNLIKNSLAPSPQWFVITKKVVSWVTTTTLAVLLLTMPENAMAIAITKLCQSSLMELLDSLIIEN